MCPSEAMQEPLSSKQSGAIATQSNIESVLGLIRNTLQSSHDDGLKGIVQDSLSVVAQEIEKDPIRAVFTAFRVGAGLSVIRKDQVAQLITGLIGRVIHEALPENQTSTTTSSTSTTKENQNEKQ